MDLKREDGWMDGWMVSYKSAGGQHDVMRASQSLELRNEAGEDVPAL